MDYNLNTENDMEKTEYDLFIDRIINDKSTMEVALFNIQVIMNLDADDSYKVEEIQKRLDKIKEKIGRDFLETKVGA